MTKLKAVAGFGIIFVLTAVVRVGRRQADDNPR